MRRRRTFGLAALGLSAALALGACSSSGSSSSGGSGGSTSAAYGAAVTSVVNPSSAKGGTLTFGNSSAPDSTDPGNTYYGYMWDFVRLYTMPLMT